MSAREDPERLALIARVAAGLSHDFVNVLTLVHATAEMIALDESVSDESRDCAHVIESAAKHAARLAHRLGTLALGGELDRRVIDLAMCVTDSADLLQQIVGHRTRVTIEIRRSPCFVVADPVELDQILLNLVFNARDAMISGGELAITVAQDEHDVVLSVSDSGSGMPAHVAARAFEPRFTTKPHGTGMGLAFVLRLVEETGGRITVESSPGAGTTVQIRWAIGGAANCG
jgi:signal transduction histidine kinase